MAFAKILKFGGTSVGTTQRLDMVAKIIIDSSHNAQGETIAACVSAMSGTTKAEGTTSNLLRLLDFARVSDSQSMDNGIDNLQQFHVRMIEGAIQDKTLKQEAIQNLAQEINKLRNFLHALAEIGEISATSRDRVIAMGEILSAMILTYKINDKRAQDPRAIFVNLNKVIDKAKNPDSDVELFGEIKERLGQLLPEMAKKSPILVLTGYMGKIEGGIIERIGRGYTDYTSALSAAATNAKVLEIWKEVDGIFSTDPRKAANAIVLPQISYQEAAELTFFGTEAIHPRTMEPCVVHGIPIRVKNVLNPVGEGTIVNNEKYPSKKGIGKAITSKKDIAVINIDSNRMTEAPGFIYKIGEIFYRHQVSIDLMATSEVSVSVTIHDVAEDKIELLLRDLNTIGTATKMQNLVAISIIGHGMQRHIGVAGKVFSLLATHNINLILISQGASELSISFVVQESDADKAVSVLHDELILPN